MKASAFDTGKESVSKRDLKSRHKENLKTSKLESKILLTNDKENDRRTRSGKESVRPIKSEPLVTDIRKVREQRALKKLSLNR